MRLLFLIFVSYILFPGFAEAQDKHFTQFYASPLTLNPALTGSSNGKYRAGLIYRSQWKGVLDNPFKTYAGSIDLKFRVLPKNPNKDYVGAGILFYSDKVAGIDFSNTQMALSGAYHKSLDPRDRQYLSVGIQLGLTQRNVNISKLTFQDQYNGLNGYTLASSEELPENNFGYPDLSVGINYTSAIGKNSRYFVGGALHHALSPKITFYRSGDVIGNARLYRKYSGQFSADLYLGNDISILPRFLFALQGPHMEINAGSNIKFKFNSYSPTSFHVGAWARPVRDEQSNIFLDAVVLMAGIEINNLVMGLSYDANISDLTTYRQGQNAFELSLVFIGEYENDEVMCPKF
ncbi:MAG TPA: type IX secretion system membrane protein PorP/SprF [Saprospiraceae bacterium]|nr:type IX secretion system membrane protein PorP/SprF [Saprospiraceae bacterium]